MRYQIPRITAPEDPRITIFVSFSGTGGVERMVVNLTKGLLDLGARIDMIPVRTESTHLENLPPSVRIIQFGSSHTLGSLPALVRYLKSEQPHGLLAAKDRANTTAVLARRLSRVPTRLVLRMGTTVSAAMAGRHPVKERVWYLRMRMLYPSADAVVAVSRGVADDLEKKAGLASSLLRIIPNPVITPELISMSQERLDHPWLQEGSVPVLLGVGRLTRQKDFFTLLRAFALVKKNRPCRLFILGEGQDRPALESMAQELGIRDHVAMPGFVQNPYAYMSRATLFVLSSRWEGSPNVLTEALALGTPVVSTDCPSGPKEILDHGRFGPLVPMGDAEAMAHAVLSTLDAPLEKSLLKSAVRAYTVEESSRRYLETLLGK